jgi:hypothetical protein
MNEEELEAEIAKFEAVLEGHHAALDANPNGGSAGRIGYLLSIAETSVHLRKLRKQLEALQA